MKLFFKVLWRCAEAQKDLRPGRKRAALANWDEVVFRSQSLWCQPHPNRTARQNCGCNDPEPRTQTRLRRRPIKLRDCALGTRLSIHAHDNLPIRACAKSATRKGGDGAFWLAALLIGAFPSDAIGHTQHFQTFVTLKGLLFVSVILSWTASPNIYVPRRVTYPMFV